MVPIPKDLEFTRDKRSERRLINMARKFLKSEHRTPGIHASDLLEPRKAYFRYLTGDKEGAMSDDSVMRFFTGKILHMMILGQADEGSVPSPRGFDYSVDFMDKTIPTELKTSGQPIKKDLSDPILQQYLRQLLIYMAEENSTVGKLWVLFMNSRGNDYMRCPQFRCAKIKVSDEALEEIRNYNKQTTEDLIYTVKVKDVQPEAFRVLPLCQEAFCYRAYCEWYDQCQPEERWKPPRKHKQ